MADVKWELAQHEIASLLAAAALTVATTGMAAVCEWQKSMVAMSTPHTTEQMTAVEIDSDKTLNELKSRWHLSHARLETLPATQLSNPTPLCETSHQIQSPDCFVIRAFGCYI